MIGDVVANRAAEHGILGLEGVKDGALRDRAMEFEAHFARHVGERAEMRG